MADKIKVHDREFELFISNDKLQTEINRIADEIRRDLEYKDPLFVCILNGAFLFAAELMHALNDEFEICFAQYSSYKGTRTTGLLQEIMHPQIPLKGRNIVIIEDIIDSGLTISHVIDSYKAQGAKDVKVACLLHKPTAKKIVDITPNYVGIVIPPEFIVGHGLDYAGKGRCFKDIYKIVENKDN